MKLRQLRERAGMTQEQLADATGARQATISNLETGRTQRIEFTLLERLACALGVKPSELWDDSSVRKR